MYELLISRLIELGFEKIETTDWMVVLRGDKYRVQVLTESNAVKIGFNETFDRWANSTDYEAKVPQTLEEVDEFLVTVNGLRKCRYCDNWHTPHQIANRPVCDDCFRNKHKSKGDKKSKK